jgi:hypothetical protein
MIPYAGTRIRCKYPRSLENVKVQLEERWFTAASLLTGNPPVDIIVDMLAPTIRFRRQGSERRNRRDLRAYGGLNMCDKALSIVYDRVPIQP